MPIRLEELTVEEEPAELKFGPTAGSETVAGVGSIVGPNFSSANVRHVRCQVVPEFKGRVQDFMDALRKSRSDGEQAIFVASTTGRAERMIELARDYQVVATAEIAPRTRASRRCSSPSATWPAGSACRMAS